IKVERYVPVPADLGVGLPITEPQDQKSLVSDRGQECARMCSHDAMSPSDERVGEGVDSRIIPANPSPDMHFVSRADGDEFPGESDRVDGVGRGLDGAQTTPYRRSWTGKENQSPVLAAETKRARPGAFADPTDIQTRDLVENFSYEIHLKW